MSYVQQTALAILAALLIVWKFCDIMVWVVQHARIVP